MLIINIYMFRVIKWDLVVINIINLLCKYSVMCCKDVWWNEYIIYIKLLKLLLWIEGLFYDDGFLRYIFIL